ncbi:hypothetical protein Ahia01_000300900 [Argonauta hians]
MNFTQYQRISQEAPLKTRPTIFLGILGCNEANETQETWLRKPDVGSGAEFNTIDPSRFLLRMKDKVSFIGLFTFNGNIVVSKALNK